MAWIPDFSTIVINRILERSQTGESFANVTVDIDSQHTAVGDDAKPTHDAVETPPAPLVEHSITYFEYMVAQSVPGMAGAALKRHTAHRCIPGLQPLRRGFGMNRNAGDGDFAHVCKTPVLNACE